MTEDATDIELNADTEDRILASLKGRDGVATAGDVAADTGLGYDRCELALQEMLGQYKSHLDVDDDGNLRYRFNPAFDRRGSDPGRAWRNFKRGAWKAFMGFFKAWTMVMLVGYTVLFVVLLIALGIAALGASMQGNNRRGGGRLLMLPFMLVARFLEFMFWWNIFSSGSGRRRRSRRGRQSGLLGGLLKRKHKRPSKPFYEKIFNYLFGPDTNQADALGSQKAFAQYVRTQNGRITAADWASRTGQTLDEAENALTAGIVRFSGDVDVSDDGELVYRFDELVVTADQDGRDRHISPIWDRRVQVADFTGNPGSTNVWISVLNGFNLAMAGFVLYAVIGLPLAAYIGLGWVPLVFSSMFFAIPLIRKIIHNRRKKRAERENQRRQALSIVFESARDGQARSVPDSSVPDEFQDPFLMGYDGDISVTDEGLTVYTFGRVARQLQAGQSARQSAAEQVVFGQTVFSSDEDEKSLDEAEMDEFDRRLSRELGGDVFEAEADQPAAVGAEVGRG